MSLSVAVAGELATLHAQLAEPAEPLACPKITTPGVMALPGSCPGTVRTVPEIEAIGLERSRCLTTCPAYTVIFQQDGSFRYEGEAFVERLGTHTGRVSQGLLEQLFFFIEDIDFMDMQDSYTSPFLDNAATYVMVETPAQTKVIENYAGSGPATLWALEMLIDQVLETAEWEPVDE